MWSGRTECEEGIRQTWDEGCKAFSGEEDGRSNRKVVSAVEANEKKEIDEMNRKRRCETCMCSCWRRRTRKAAWIGKKGSAIATRVGSNVCELILDNVTARQLDAIGDLIGPDNDRILEDKLNSNGGDVVGISVLDCVIDGTLDLIIESVAIEGTTLQEDVMKVVAFAAEGDGEQKGGLVHGVVFGG